MVLVNTHKNYGFTVLELMITVAIGGIISIFAIPAFTALIDNNKLVKVSNEFNTAFKIARNTAISKTAPTYICPSANADTAAPTCDLAGNWLNGYIIYVKPSFSSSKVGFLNFVPASDELIYQVDLKSVTNDIAIAQTNAAIHIGFDNQGFTLQPAPPAVAANPRLSVCDSAGTKGKIYQLSTSGRLTVSDANPSILALQC
ncbi:MAG: GspH/FimT family pseudopilin [Arenicella sp.]